MSAEAASFYVFDGLEPKGSAFLSTRHTVGPWSTDHQHGGPPSSLVARCVEETALPGFCLVRMTVQMTRPVPVGRLIVRTRVVRDGRQVKTMEAVLIAHKRAVMRATCQLVRVVNEETSPPRWRPAVISTRGPEEGTPFQFPFFQVDESYLGAMDVRVVQGVFGEGPVTAWFRQRIPLVHGEEPSPACRVIAAADSGNGLSPVVDWRTHTFVNPDLTVYLVRPLVGEWVGLTAQTHVSAGGLGLASTVLFDQTGEIGRGHQSLLVRKR